MSDLLHDHIEFGFHAGCPACEQAAEVLATHPGHIDAELLAVVTG